MLSFDEGKKAVVFAREIVDRYVKENNYPELDLGKTFALVDRITNGEEVNMNKECDKLVVTSK